MYDQTYVSRYSMGGLSSIAFQHLRMGLRVCGSTIGRVYFVEIR